MTMSHGIRKCKNHPMLNPDFESWVWMVTRLLKIFKKHVSEWFVRDITLRNISFPRITYFEF